MREREALSIGERDYISSKLTGWKVVSFFLPGLGQMWSRRRGLFWGGACISLGLGFLLGAIGGSDGIEVASFLGWLINVILTLVKFTEKAYKHDMPYFQKYLYEYAKLSGGSTKRQIRTNLYEEDNEDETVLYSKKSSTSKYDKYGFDEDGYNRQGYDAYGFDREGFNRQGYNEEGFDKDGFDKNGYNYKGFDKDGYDKNGYNKRGFDRNGLGKDGYDEYGEKRTGKTKKPTPKKNNTVLNKKSKK